MPLLQMLLPPSSPLRMAKCASLSISSLIPSLRLTKNMVIHIPPLYMGRLPVGSPWLIAQPFHLSIGLPWLGAFSCQQQFEQLKPRAARCQQKIVNERCDTLCHINLLLGCIGCWGWLAYAAAILQSYPARPSPAHAQPTHSLTTSTVYWGGIKHAVGSNTLAAYWIFSGLH